jgi:acyl carrier protein
MAPHRRDTDTPLVPPRTETERALAGIWEELLGVAPVGIEDVFSELGGDSLLGTQLIARVERLLGCRMPFRSLFEEPTVRLQARRVESLRAATAAPQTAPTARDADGPDADDDDDEEGRI